MTDPVVAAAARGVMSDEAHGDGRVFPVPQRNDDRGGGEIGGGGDDGGGGEVGGGGEIGGGSEVGGGGAGEVGGGGDDGGRGEGDGWSETRSTTLAGRFGRLRPWESLAARAVAASTTMVAAQTAMAALTGLRGRIREIQCTVAPCIAGGAPDGHSAASKSAASARCDRPRLDRKSVV